MTLDDGMDARRDESDAVPASSGSSSARSRVLPRIVVGLVSVILIGLLVIAGALWSRTHDLERDVAAMQRSARIAKAHPAPATGDAAGIEVDISKFKTCVNDYMATIGKWSANVGSRYTYDFCK